MIPPTLAPHLLDYAVNTLWQLPLLAAATWLLIRLTRPTTFTQHLLWIATLLLAVTLPLRGYATYIPALTLPASNLSVPHSSTAPSSMSGSTTIPEPAPKSVLLHPHQIAINPTLLTTLVRLWLLALAVNLLRLTGAWITSRRLIASATHNPETLDPIFLQSCADRLQIAIPEIRFLNSPSATPVVAGIFHPILLLPTHLAHDYELTAVLLHEFAHIRRCDTLTNALCRLLALPIAWHPVTPLLHTRIAQTREILCDALAAEATGSPTAYARSLLTLARDLTQPNNHPIATLGLFSTPHNSSALEERIMSLIAPAAPTLSHRAIRISAGIALVTAATLTAAAFHLQAASAAERHTPSAAIVLTSAHMPQQTFPPAPPAPPSPPVGTLPTPLAPLRPLPAARALTVSATLAPLPPLAPAPLPPLPPLPELPQAVPTPPAPAPPPPPAPKPTHHSRIIIDDKDRPLTPAEQADLDKQLAEINSQVKAAMAGVHIDQQQLQTQIQEQLKQLKSPDFSRQMAGVQEQLNSPNFQKQIAEATRLASKQGIDQAMNSEAMREQFAQASREIAKAQAEIAKQHLDIQIDTAKMQAQIQTQIKSATDALAHTKLDIHIDTADLQRQLDQAQHQIDEARKRLKETAPHQ